VPGHKRLLRPWQVLAWQVRVLRRPTRTRLLASRVPGRRRLLRARRVPFCDGRVRVRRRLARRRLRGAYLLLRLQWPWRVPRRRVLLRGGACGCLLRGHHVPRPMLRPRCMLALGRVRVLRWVGGRELLSTARDGASRGSIGSAPGRRGRRGHVLTCGNRISQQ